MKGRNWTEVHLCAWADLADLTDLARKLPKAEPRTLSTVELNQSPATPSEKSSRSDQSYGQIRRRLSPTDANVTMSLRTKNAVTVSGTGSDTLIFAHGFGCDQSVWRHLAPIFQGSFNIVLYDHVGAGRSDISAYSEKRYGTLDRYALDTVEIAREFGRGEVTIVGHSVGAMIGLLATIKAPELFSNLIMVAPSPCYLNTTDYQGGFSRAEIAQLLDYIDSNLFGWSATYAPVIMGNPDRPHLTAELAENFCRMDPDIAKAFARVTFLSDCRDRLPAAKIRALALQCAEDAIAPSAVGEYVAGAMPNCRLVKLDAIGHCPHQSAPAEVATAITDFLRSA